VINRRQVVFQDVVVAEKSDDDDCVNLLLSEDDESTCDEDGGNSSTQEITEEAFPYPRHRQQTLVNGGESIKTLSPPLPKLLKQTNGSTAISEERYRI